MKTFISYILYFLLKFALWLRYRVTVKGLDAIKKHTFSKSGGVLFLANHPAMIDPPILIGLLWPHFKPHPIALDSLFHKPVVRMLLRYLGALPVPNFDNSSNSFKRKRIEKTYQEIFNHLHRGENLLIYPAGSLKHMGEEVIGGASGVHHILQNCPDANVVLVRTLGLWGSTFSRAITGSSPNLGNAFIHGFKAVLKNLIFFTPRRHVEVEFAIAPPDFPYEGQRREINSYLEQWYNAKGIESPILVSFSRWREEYPEIEIQKERKPTFTEKEIPEEISQAVKSELAHLIGKSEEEITPSLHLANDLALDSLDLSQIVVFLKDSFGVGQIHSHELNTVYDVMAFAAHLKEGEKEEGEEEKKGIRWKREKKRPSITLPTGKTIAEVFLHRCDRMDDYASCSDLASGLFSYKDLKLAALIFAKKFESLPGKRIGIMLPASVAVMITIFATLLARKIPVMINWTLGPRNLKAVLEESGIDVVLSSLDFLNRLDNVELDGVDEKIVLLESIKSDLSLYEMLKGKLLSLLPARVLISLLKLKEIDAEDPAVILFTSGTENLPKGVPLSHRNLLANQKAAFEMVAIKDRDVLLGILPPFHSFGFSVTGIFPILFGLRVAFSPNPTDGRRVGLAIARWRVTLLCIAPTFLKTLLRVASPAHLRSLRLVVTGAEKTPEEIFTKMKELNRQTVVAEGYGITECAPILTLNPPQEKKGKGVGRPLPGVELLIVHPETYEVLPQGEQGLILAHGPNIFKGYLDPKRGTPFVTLNNKKWYETGDIGVLDENGYLTLLGRLKRFVKIGGEMISLGAIEEVLAELTPEDQNTGPILAVGAEEDEGKKSELILFTSLPFTLEEVNQHLRKKGMSNLIKISRIKKLPFLPLLGTGKVDYRALMEKLKKEGR